MKPMDGMIDPANHEPHSTKMQHQFIPMYDVLVMD
jgi:hypothetical protein